MRIRFLGDANFNQRIVAGIRRREPRVDFQLHQDVIPSGMIDPMVLVLAASSGRILVTHDHKTIPGHFYSFLAKSDSPGVLIIPTFVPLAVAIEQILLMWSCSEAEEWVNRLEWLPFKSCALSAKL